MLATLVALLLAFGCGFDADLSPSRAPAPPGSVRVLSPGEDAGRDAGVDAGSPEVDAAPPMDAGSDPPPDLTCHETLDWLGLDWTMAGEQPGIDDPVLVEPVIAGVEFRYVSRAEPTTMLMDCTLAPRLHALALLVREYDVDEVVHIGIYNYRCIGGGDPASGCTPSQHAYARAIDLHEFNDRTGGASYNVETDWVISSAEDVCPGSPRDDADRVLHEIACRMWSDEIFHIVLTPDYNADHRNHFHVDITPGADFIGESVTGIDPILPGLGD